MVLVLVAYNNYPVIITEYALLVTALNMHFTEKMNKVHIDDLDTDILISFAEWTGTGMIKPKDKSVNLNVIKKELRAR
jgi:hypothetical protein